MCGLLSQLLPHERGQMRVWQTDIAITRKEIEPRFAQSWDWEGVQRTLGASKEAIAARIAHWSVIYPHWTRDQILTALAIDSVALAVDQNLGIARRLIHDDPAELALGVCLGTRAHWLKQRLAEQSGMGTEEGDGYFAQLALSVLDHALIQRVLEMPILELDPVRNLLYLGVAAAYRRDFAALRLIAEKLVKRKVDRIFKGPVACLLGIELCEPARVQDAIKEMLDTENWLRKRKEGTILCMEAHQFYRLAEWVAPGLAAGFDATQTLPWDAAFHCWTQAHTNPLEGLDLTHISPILHSALVDLKLPGWWRVLKDPELPTDPCRLVLTAVGPNPQPVRELIDGWSRVLQWEPVDLETCPVRLGSNLPRGRVFAMRTSLLKAGASASFEKISGSESTKPGPSAVPVHD